MTTIISWTFHRGPCSITCAVEATGQSAFEVCVLTHWNLALSTVEHFTNAHEAFGRHAEIAMRLRESGWLTEHASHRSPLPPLNQRHAQHGATAA